MSNIEDQPDDAASDEGEVAPGPDEVFCTSCGETIKAEAEVCPDCGVRQVEAEGEVESGSTITDARRYELEKIAGKDVTTIMLVSFLLTPAGYLMIGKTGLAIINFLTFNYFLLGFIIVPFHTRKIIREAQDELRRAGVAGY